MRIFRYSCLIAVALYMIYGACVFFFHDPKSVPQWWEVLAVGLWAPIVVLGMVVVGFGSLLAIGCFITWLFFGNYDSAMDRPVKMD